MGLGGIRAMTSAFLKGQDEPSNNAEPRSGNPDKLSVFSGESDCKHSLISEIYAQAH